MANLLTSSARRTDPGGDVSLTAGEEHGELVIRARDDVTGSLPSSCPRCSSPSCKVNVAEIAATAASVSASRSSSR
jgi:hypothetical protein